MLKSSSLASVRVSHDVERLDVAMHETLLLEVAPLLVLGFG